MNDSLKLRSWQRRKMFAIMQSIDWTIDDLRDVVDITTGQRHISALTRLGGNETLKKLEELAKDVLRRQPHPSKDQVNKIYKLGYLLHWNTTTIKRFNKRTTGNWDIYEDTPVEASKLIMAMEGVIRDEKKKHAHQKN